MSGLGSAFGRLLGRMRPASPLATAALMPLPDVPGPIYAVGDVHGCCRLYRQIEDKILEHADSLNAEATVILLGDVVDRGDESAMMLDHLLARPPRGMRRFCLMGNHEELMLRFLADPASALSWLDFGGFETLASYGIGRDIEELRALSARRLSQAVAAVVPESHKTFLARLPLALGHGPYVFAHAGLDGSHPLDAQPRDALLWGRCAAPPPAGVTLVRGHFIHPQPLIEAQVIGIDTGAYATGRLTTVCLSPGLAPSFLTVERPAAGKR